MTNPINEYTANHLENYVLKYRCGYQHDKERIVTEFLGDIKGKKVLDAGCGPGVFSSYCHKKKAEVFALDFSPVMLNFVHAHNRELPAIQAAAQNPCFRKESFDIVLALDVIEHLHNPKLFLQELQAILKRDGRALLITDNTQAHSLFKLFAKIYANTLWRVFRSLPRRPKFPPGHHKSTHVKEYTVDELKQLLKRASFRIQDYGTFTNIPFFGFIDRLFSFFLRGPLKKYKWNRVYFHLMKS